MAEGGGQPNINQDTVRSLRIPAPSDPVQQQQIVERVREITEQAESLSVAVDKQIESLRELRQALITTAVSEGVEACEAVAV